MLPLFAQFPLSTRLHGHGSTVGARGGKGLEPGARSVHIVSNHDRAARDVGSRRQLRNWL